MFGGMITVREDAEIAPCMRLLPPLGAVAAAGPDFCVADSFPVAQLRMCWVGRVLHTITHGLVRVHKAWVAAQ